MDVNKMAHKRLFLLNFILGTDGTIDFCIYPQKATQFAPELDEVYPISIIGYVYVTTDLAAARTITVSLQELGGQMNLIMYDVTPDLDNNTVRLAPFTKTDDSAAASVSDLLGSVHNGFVATEGTMVRHVGSGAIGAADTVTVYLLYEGFEYAAYENRGTAPLTLIRHLHLGIIHPEGVQK